MASFDISSILNTREPGQEFFLDYCHVNHEANRIVARAIFERITALLASR